MSEVDHVFMKCERGWAFLEYRSSCMDSSLCLWPRINCRGHRRRCQATLGLHALLQLSVAWCQPALVLCWLHFLPSFSKEPSLSQASPIPSLALGAVIILPNYLWVYLFSITFTVKYVCPQLCSMNLEMLC